MAQIIFFAISVLLSLTLSNVRGQIYLYSDKEGHHQHILTDDCEEGILTGFPPNQTFTCVCLTGIYVLHESVCGSDGHIYGGDGHCFKLKNTRIGRLELLSPTHIPSIVIMDPSTKSVRGRYNESGELANYRKGDTLMVQGSWTLMTSEGGQFCITSDPWHYCLYRKIPKFVAYRPGTCHGTMGKKEESIESECHLISPPNDIVGSCFGKLERSKRAVKGRTFVPASLAMAPIVQAPPDERDEDYGMKGTNGSLLIKAEIFNFVISEAAEILEGEIAKSPIHYQTPAYDLLQLSKEIMMKSCPDYYVPRRHWELAVSSFIAMQQRSFKFRETLIDLKELEGITATLRKCLLNTNPIPFIPPTETCVDGKTILKLEPGMYYQFNSVQTLTIPAAMMSLKNEPIIETVWKIFVHVHSHCYEYFKESRFNYHHRYTTIINPLFTNDAFDIWMKDENGNAYELYKDVYGGLLGDALKLMQNVDYCAWFSRFTSSYPWDMVRPTAKTISILKKKRSIDDVPFGLCSPSRHVPAC